jgi:hypothetical protein
MPKYIVTIEWKKTKELNVFASDEDAAEEKALEIVSSWDIDDPEVVDVTED